MQTVAKMVLQALRAGPLMSYQLEARFGRHAGTSVYQLKKLGYIEYIYDGGAQITARGRENCPSRRRTAFESIRKVSQSITMEEGVAG